MNRHDNVETIIENETDLDARASVKFAAASEYINTDQRNRALTLYRKTVRTGIEPYAERALSALLRHNPGSLSQQYLADFRRFINLYPENSNVQRFAWETTRAMIRNDRISDAKKIMDEALKAQPRGSFSDNFRYWLREIALDEGAEEKAYKLKEELSCYNHDSAYAWIPLAEKADNLEHNLLKEKFKEAIQNNDHDKAILYNALLYLKENDISKRNKRLEQLGLPDLQVWKDILSDINEFRVSGKNRDLLKNLEKYFRAGDSSSITRELSFVDEDEIDAYDKRIALVHYGKAADIPRYFASPFEELYARKGLRENLFIMPEELIYLVLPRPFSECVHKSADEFNVKPEVIWSVMKAESMYSHVARSSVNAQGLMQIMPATGRGIARSLGVQGHNPFDPCTSIRFGAKYLGDMNRMFGGEFHFTAAAYNAGPGSLRRWDNNLPADNIVHFADKIPFSETRLYVLKTKRFLIQYQTFQESGTEIKADHH